MSYEKGTLDTGVGGSCEHAAGLGRASRGPQGRPQPRGPEGRMDPPQ